MTKAQKITKQGGVLKVPDSPIVPFIEGDGTGPDIWAASVRVFDAAVRKSYWPVKRRTTRPEAGFPRRPWRSSRTASWASRDL
jgi:hypothetical protein